MLAMRFASCLLVVALALSAAPAIAAPSEPLVPKEKRSLAPKMSLRDMEGKKHQLVELKGKIVVLNFWATWCGPCKAEMPEFTQVHAAYRDKGVEFVGAANETRAERKKVQEFVDNLKIQFPIWLEASLDHMEAFGVGPGLPATVILDPQGRVAVRIKGPTDAAELRAFIDQILLEATPTTASSGGR